MDDRLTITLIREMAITGELEGVLEEAKTGPRVSPEWSKVGRNDPCPCGSGRKFKKCCLPLVEEDRPATRLERAQEAGLSGPLPRLTDRLLRFVGSSRCKADMNAAMDEFLSGIRMRGLPDDEEGGSPVSLLSIFTDWSLFGRSGEGGFTVAEEYARARGDSLPPDEKEILDAAMGGWFSVYEVLEVFVDEGLKVKDIFRDRTLDVREKLATRTLARWDLFGGRVGPVEDHYEMVSTVFPIPLETGKRLEKYAKRKCREAIKKGDVEDMDRFLEHKGYLLAAYTYRQIKKIADRGMPTIVTAEGDLMCLCVAYFQVESPNTVTELLEREPCIEPDPGAASAKGKEKAFDWFMSPEMEEELRAGDHLGLPMPAMPGHGVPEEAHAATAGECGDENVDIGHQRRVFGFIALSGNTLELETNSRERLEYGKSRLIETLGDLIRHRLDSLEDQDVLFDRLTAGPGPGVTGAEGKIVAGGTEAVDNKKSIDPDVEKLVVTEYLERHYATWPDTPVPALNNKTPREATRTKAGRRKVNALLKQFENASEKEARAGKPTYDFSRLRKELSIPPDA